MQDDIYNLLEEISETLNKIEEYLEDMSEK